MYFSIIISSSLLTLYVYDVYDSLSWSWLYRFFIFAAVTILSKGSYLCRKESDLDFGWP